MAGSGQTSIKFNDAFFDQILNSAGVRALTVEPPKGARRGQGQRAVDTGAYRDGLQVEAVQRAPPHHLHGGRPMTRRPCWSSPKTGNLRKALKAVKL